MRLKRAAALCKLKITQPLEGIRKVNKLTITAIAAVSAALFGVSGAYAEGGNFANVDADHDSKVTLTEATGAYPTLTQAQFDQADSNKDGSLDEAEFGTLAGLLPAANENGGSSSSSSAAAPSSSSAAQ